MSIKGKFLILTAVCAVLALLCVMEVGYESVKSPSLLRFHVIANSDSLYDQEVKQKVRNAVLDEINVALEEAQNAAEAKQIIAAENEHFITVADNVLKAENCGYDAESTLGTSVFPTKRYGDLTLAAGKYNAYRIILGNGEGKNWWCVLYPPLCFVDISDDVAVAVTVNEENGIEDEETNIVKAAATPYKIEVKSKLLEFMNLH